MQDKDKYKVTNGRWSDDDLQILEKVWLEVLAEESAKDPLFKKVADHYLSWRRTYKVGGPRRPPSMVTVPVAG